MNEFEQGYAALAMGDTIQIGFQRNEDRLIASLVKAEPQNLPRAAISRIMVTPDGRMTTEHTAGGESRRIQKALDPNASEITPAMQTYAYGWDIVPTPY